MIALETRHRWQSTVLSLFHQVFSYTSLVPAPLPAVQVDPRGEKHGAKSRTESFQVAGFALRAASRTLGCNLAPLLES